MKLTETEKRFIQNLDIEESHYASLPRFSIHEMVEKTVEQRKVINANMDATHPSFDFDEANIYAGLGDEDKTRMVKSLANTPLSRLMYAAAPELGLKLRGITEFLARSGTAGINGAIYLIPDKIYQVLFDSAVEEDVVERISIAVIPPDQIPGSKLKVDIAVDDSYAPTKYSTGGIMAGDEVTVAYAELDFTTPWGINFRIANDLIEDSQFDMIEYHLRQAGREFGEYASNDAITILRTATDGDGDVNSGTAEASQTYFDESTNTDIVKALAGNLVDGFRSDLLVCSHHAMLHSIMGTAGLAYEEGTVYNEFLHNGYPTKLAGMDVILSSVNILTNSKANTLCQTIVCSKQYSLLSGRKRWLRIENYSDPIRDLVGATVTARQDSVTVYDDSVFRITES